MPATIAAAPASWARPNGSPKAATPMAVPTSGSRLRNGAAAAADTRDWPKANSVNGAIVNRARPSRTGSPARTVAACGSGSVSAASGSMARVAAANCTAVTAIGSRPGSSLVWATVNEADTSSDSRTRPSPVMLALPWAPDPAISTTPASDTASARPRPSAGPRCGTRPPR